jgi:hypothetical protein
MLKNVRVKLTNKWVALAGTFGAGLLPCPDCGVPLAVHIWPVVGVIWLYRRFQRRSINKLDLLLLGDERGHAMPDASPPGDHVRPDDGGAAG